MGFAQDEPGDKHENNAFVPGRVGLHITRAYTQHLHKLSPNGTTNEKNSTVTAVTAVESGALDEATVGALDDVGAIHTQRCHPSQ